MKDNLTITEMSKLFDVSPHTIRFYEKEGLLTSVLRTEGGVRRYGMEAMSELESIIILRYSGIPLSEIKALQARYSDDKYEDMLNKSYQLVCDEIKKLDKIKKRLRQSIDYREGYTHGEITVKEHKASFLTPIEKYDEHVFESPRSIYEFSLNHVGIVDEYEENGLSLIELNGDLHLCKREKKQKERSLCFKEGSYLHYHFTGYLRREEINKAKKHLKEYAKMKHMSISNIAIIFMSMTASLAIGNPDKDIVEIYYLIEDDKKRYK